MLFTNIEKEIYGILNRKIETTNVKEHTYTIYINKHIIK